MSLHATLTLLLLLTPGESLDKGRAALENENYDVAVGHLRSAVDAHPTDVGAWLLLGRGYLGQGDRCTFETQADWDRMSSLYQQAEEAVRTAIDVDESGDRSTETWGLLGETLLKQGNASEAIATLYHAQKFAPADLSIHRDLAEAILMARSYALESEQFAEADARLAEAESVIADALALAEAQTDLLRSMGDVRTAQGDLAAAMQHYRRAIALRPDDVLLHNAYLDTLRASQAFDEGLDYYTGLVDAPALARWYKAETRELKGNVAFQKDKDYDLAAKQYAAAEKDLRASAEHNPEYGASADARIPYLRSYRGFALVEAGKLEDAETALFSALDREPSLEHARNGLRRLMDAHFVKIGGEKAKPEEFDTLRAFAARVCMVIPDDAAFWNNYGFFSREAKRYEESYQAYRRAIRLEPDNARYLNDTALILLYHLKRDMDLAEEWFRDAREISDQERADAQSQSRIDSLTETYGDAIANLILLCWNEGRRPEAEELFRTLEEELPKRTELKFWRKKMFPEEAAELERKAKEEKDAKEKKDAKAKKDADAKKSADSKD